MRLRDQIDEAQHTHNILDMVPHQGNRKYMVCPLPSHAHHSYTPSFSVFWKKGVQYWKCHGSCNLAGDVIDLVGYTRINGYDPHEITMKRRALQMLDEKYEYSIPIPPKVVKLAFDRWKEFVPAGEEVINYAYWRGLSPETLKKFRIGQDGHWMTMPTFHEHKLMGIKCRNIERGKLRYVSLPGSIQGIFNFNTIQYTQKTVLIVKAEIPCMLLDQLGFLTCAPTGGEGGWDEEWRSALGLANKIVVGDNDGPGRILGAKRAALLSARLVFPPDPYKDIDEFYLMDREIALSTIHSWTGS